MEGTGGTPGIMLALNGLTGDELATSDETISSDFPEDLTRFVSAAVGRVDEQFLVIRVRWISVYDKMRRTKCYVSMKDWTTGQRFESVPFHAVRATTN